MKLGKVSALLLLLLAVSSAARAQAPPSWIDVVANFGADPTCTMDSGPSINSAISSVTKPGGVLFFPAGCYLINTRIVDKNPVGGITYLGLGRVTLQSGPKLAGSIIDFGVGPTTGIGPSVTVTGRRISNLVFQCGPGGAAQCSTPLHGINVWGMTNSVFEDVEIDNFPGYALEAVQFGSSDILFDGGLVSTNSAGASGIYLGYLVSNWTFKGTTFSGAGGTNQNSPNAGLLVEGNSTTCVGCDIHGWWLGLAAGLSGEVHGLEISGGVYAGNLESNISIGRVNGALLTGPPKVFGLSMHGARIVGSGSVSNQAICVDLQHVDGFTVTGNEIVSCQTTTVRALADQGTPQIGGADNGVVGPNSVAYSTGGYDLQGTNISLFAAACNNLPTRFDCGYSSSGIIAILPGSSAVQIHDGFVTPTSRIMISEDPSLGPSGAYVGGAFSCDTTLKRNYAITGKGFGNFTIAASQPLGSLPACLAFHIEN